MVVSSFPTNVTIYDLIDNYGIEATYDIINDLPDWEAEILYYDWDFWARDAQKIPAWEWRVWFLMGGRGVGKTRVGAEVTRKKSDEVSRINIVGRTAADVRDVMIEGPSGILEVSPPWNRPKYNVGKRRLTWDNGARALCFSADEPNLLRGPQCGFGWLDEIASWRYLEDTWNNFMFGLRLGSNPQAVATSTPRPVKVVKKLVADDGRTVHVTRESTYANRRNLAEGFFVDIVSAYENTRLGQQEIYGQVLDDNPHALWTTELIDDTRVNKVPKFDKIVVGVDPSTKEDPTEESAECGIVVMGLNGRKASLDAHGYVLNDMSIKGSPTRWGEQVVSAVHKHDADYVVAESNNGGAMVKGVIQAVDPTIKVVLVHASRGKKTRAEPVSTIHEKKRIHFLGQFPELETQLTEWEPGMDSPDRLDAFVWVATDLMVGEKKKTVESY